ncbi:CAP domain-containing protein [Kribbella sp. NBC_01505]|uniref:CAP domain-containing protein n=1 Tax=Kribbella sp. NBC_01505 TaxID=2903580 RepID=UPI003862E52E
MTDPVDRTQDDEPLLRERRRRVATAPLIGALLVLGLVAVGGWYVARDPKQTVAVRQRTIVQNKVTAHPVVLRSTPTPTPSPTRSPRVKPSAKPTPTPPLTHPSTTRPRPRPTPPPPTTAKPPPKPPVPSGSPQAREILRLTNTERANAGCRPLQLNSALTQAAQNHATDMVAHHYFAHNSQDGRTPADRMRAAGFGGTSTAENLATGSRDPAAVVNAWMNNETDRANLLNCAFTMLGVGYDSGRIKSKWSAGTWTQDLGT